MEQVGPGVCAADFDGDGYQDIYFVNGRDRYNRGIRLQNALYRNNGDGTFTDVTAKAGVPGNAYGLGCVWGDYDNGGHPDLYVTQYGKNILYHNNGWDLFVANDGLEAYLYDNNHDGAFTNMARRAGWFLHPIAQQWPPCAPRSAITIMTADLTCICPIFNWPPITSGITTERLLPGGQRIGWHSRADPQCLELRRRTFRLR